MGELSDGDWGAVPYPPPEHDPPIRRGRPDDEEPKPDGPPPPQPKTDEWPVRKAKEPKGKE